MKKWMKIAIGVVAGLLVLVIAGGAFVGNYFLSYALVRSEDGVAGGDREVANEVGVSADESTIGKNRRAQDEATAAWLAGAASEEWSLTSADGLKLAATCYPAAAGNHRWVIAVHGYTSSQESMQDTAQHYAEQGYSVLTPDLRAHGKSEGQYIGMGWLDRQDLLLWIDRVIERDAEAEIVLHGVSMGAATVMMTAGEETLPARVKAVVEDCGYTDVQSVFANELKLRFGLPPFPIMNCFNIVSGLRAGYTCTEASAVKQVMKSRVPILFIHGDADDFIPVEMGEEVYLAAACEKELLIVEGAGHAEAAYADPAAYYRKVFDFVGRYVSGDAA